MSSNTSNHPAVSRRGSSGGAPQNWYQTNFALVLVSMIVAVVIVSLVWPWDEIQQTVTKDFCITYQVELPESEHLIVKEYENYSDCPQDSSNRGVAIRAQFEGPVRLLKKLEEKEKSLGGWAPISVSVKPKNTTGWQSFGVSYQRVEELDQRFSSKSIRLVNESEWPKTGRYKVVEVEKRVLRISPTLDTDHTDEVRYEANADPKEVVVWVEKGMLTPSIPTEVIETGGAEQDDVIEDVKLNLPAHVSLVRPEDETIRVELLVTPKRERRLLQPIAITLRNNRVSGYDVTAEPPFVAVQVTIDATQRDKMDAFNNVTASIDIRDASVETQEETAYEVTLRGLPSWVNAEEDITIQPPKAKLLYEKKGE